MICEDKETNDNWKKKNNKIILSASAFNSCMIEFSIPDFNKTIIKNIISLFLSFLNTERRKVVFRTHGQYCSEWEGRGYHFRCTSVPLSLYFISILWWLVIIAFHRRRVKVNGSLFFQTITGTKVRFFIFPNNHRRQSKVLFVLFLQHGLAFPHFPNAQQVTKAAVFHVSVG